VDAVDDMFEKTSTKTAPWNLVPANHKHYARRRVLEIVASGLRHHGKWMEKKALNREAAGIRRSLEKIELERKK